MGSLILPSSVNGTYLDKRSAKLSDILASRVLTGFLRAYADSQHSSENLAFVQAELDFREHFAAYERSETVEEEAKKLFDKYIDEDKAELQICLTSDEYVLAKSRMERKEYNASMFEIFLPNPKLTVERDIFPRFRNSVFFTEMQSRLTSPVKPYLSDSPGEKISLLDDTENPPDLESDDKRFTFEEIMQDFYLFSVFKAFLEESHSAESATCVFEIDVFKRRHGKTDVSPTETQDRAFAIYFTFLQPGATDEVSVESFQRHSIGGFLAMELPPADLFDQLRATLVRQIKGQSFGKFSSSQQFASLVKVLRKVKEERAKGDKRSSKTCAVM